MCVACPKAGGSPAAAEIPNFARKVGRAIDLKIPPCSWNSNQTGFLPITPHIVSFWHYELDADPEELGIEMENLRIREMMEDFAYVAYFIGPPSTNQHERLCCHWQEFSLDPAAIDS
jgi:hypothetical protein